MFYREDRKGQVLQEGINEAGAFSSWIAAATSYSNHDVQMVPFYVFYSMFGFQRSRRSRLGGGRLPGPRLPDRRHRRADDAERRGPAARGRPQPRARIDDPQLRLLRPRLRLRARGDRPRGPAADDRRAGGRLLLPDGDERELPASGDARGRRGGDPARHARRPPAEGRRRRAAARLGHDPARGRGGGRDPRRGLGRRGRGLERDQLHRAAPRGPAPRPRGAPASGEEAAKLGGGVPRWYRRPGDRRQRLHEGAARRDPRVGPGALRGARDRRLRPLRLPPRSAPVLRGRPRARRRRGARRARRGGVDRARQGRRGDREVRDRPRRAGPRGDA